MALFRRPVLLIPPGQRRRIVTGLAGLGGGPSHREGGFPGRYGGPGSGVSPYSEEEVWGGPQGATVSAPVDWSVPQAPQTGPQSSDGLSVPNGQSFVPWKNPTTVSSVPIQLATPVNVPVLSLNLQRNLLIVENNSTATSPDIAPILYVGFNTVPIIGLSLGIGPFGGSLVLDVICPRDSIYVAWGPSTGASVVTQGAVAQGTFIKMP